MGRDDAIAESIGKFRDILGRIGEGGPDAAGLLEYQKLRQTLVGDPRVCELLPDFVIECRSPRDFWNYIQRAFKKYADRSRYIEAHLLPVERQFRPERQRAPGTRPPEVRIEYSPVRPVSKTGLKFVSEDRIAELRTARGPFDLRKLVRLCEELNVAYGEGCYLATAALVRSILDHVPPIFEKRSFAEVANSYGGKSFKETMLRLETSARKISDGHLHNPVRSRETLPVAQQVNFAAEVDVLLSEVVRVMS